MPTSQDLLDGLYTWAMNNGILTDDARREMTAASGDPNLIPFEEKHAKFFSTRKIARFSSRKKAGVTTITLFARLPIAKKKADDLKKAFNERYGKGGFVLEVDVARPFKIDQNIRDTLNPVHHHEIEGAEQKWIACGSSVGLGNQRNAGTLTALGKSENGCLVGISCNHVTGGCNTARPGTPIVVPGIQDVSPENHEITVIGVHDFTGPMSQGLPQVFDIKSNCDIAFFQINEDQADLLSSMQGSGDKAYDTPTEFAVVREGQKVKKWGRTTDCTRGTVKRIVRNPQSIDYKITSYFGPTSSQVFNGTVFFKNFYEVESLGVDPFSVGGDSGSLVVTDVSGNEKVVGILIGGNDTKSYVLPLRYILKDRKVSLINGHNV
jgi:hypothetical protein